VAESGRLRVALYTDSTGRGGAEQSVANLLGDLHDEIEVTLLGVDREIVTWLAAFRPGIEVRLLPPVRNKYDLGPIAAHIRAMKELRPTVLHANLRWIASCQYAIVAGLLTPGVRVLAVEQCPMPMSSRLQVALKRITSGRLDAHIAVGVRSARLLEEMLKLPPGSVRTIYNGVTEPPDDGLCRSSSRPLVGSLGRLSHEKGFDVLVQAVAKLDQAELVLVGDGPERPVLEALARQLGVSDRVRITGWQEDGRTQLPTFDVFVLPSRFEGFPLAIPEAMLEGLPVVATSVGSVPEAVLHGETGFLVPADDADALATAIAEVLADPERARRMGERGRSLAQERFTASAMARAFEFLYEELAS
jgi:glycosyltransferase involved in cell wall biosynthesis